MLSILLRKFLHLKYRVLLRKPDQICSNWIAIVLILSIDRMFHYDFDFFRFLTFKVTVVTKGA
jgi:hypothetical protein